MAVTDATEPPFSRIAIVGIGLIGGSIAQAVHQRLRRVAVVGLDRPEILRVAQDQGVIDEPRQSINDLRDVELIVLATPVPEIVALIESAAGAGIQALVTDVGSTKRRVMAAAGAAGLRSFVGGHPMAGAETGGLVHARPDLFERRPWLLVRDGDGVDDQMMSRLERFVQRLGAEPQRVEASTHDRVMAYVSHLPQLLSSVLMKTTGAAVGQGGLALAGRGLEDMARLASSPTEVWRGVLATNADFVADAVASLLAELPATSDELQDPTLIEQTFDQARFWHDRLVGNRKSEI